MNAIYYLIALTEVSCVNGRHPMKQN